MKNPILIINTGGTFNKKYNPHSGELEVDDGGSALQMLSSKWQCKFEIVNIIGKDSLEMTNHDRLELLATIHQSDCHKILIVHGTDTMHVSAAYLADADLEKQVVLTGAMVPYHIDPVEAAANVSSAYGFLQASPHEGIYIAMNGTVAPYEKIQKDREAGRFVPLT